MVFWGGLRWTVLTSVLILWFYALLLILVKEEEQYSQRVWNVLDRLAWHNASARPPIILVFVVLGWSVVINRCRNAGMKPEMVLGPGPILPARATLRCALALLNVILLIHLIHFVAEEILGNSQPWYLMCDLALHLVIFTVFLYPPVLATALSTRPSDAGLILLATKKERNHIEDQKDISTATNISNERNTTSTILNENRRYSLPSGTQDEWYDGQQISDDDDEPLPKNFTRDGLLFPESRAGLARAIRETLFAPFAPVTFWHIIVADYATSLAKALADLQITTCVAASASNDYFFNTNNIHTTQNTISKSDAIFDHYKRDCGASIANACALALPFWCRLAQCIKCYAQTRERKHLMNALKYCSAFPLVACGFIKKNTHPADVFKLRRAQNLLIITAVLNSSFSFAWDVTMDWGLFRPKRKTIVLARLSPFMAALAYALLLACNLGMRFAWAVSVFSHAGASSAAARLFILETIEIARRTVWAVFRIELEYIARDCPVYPKRAIHRAVHTALKRKMTAKQVNIPQDEVLRPLVSSTTNENITNDIRSSSTVGTSSSNLNVDLISDNSIK